MSNRDVSKNKELADRLAFLGVTSNVVNHFAKLDSKSYKTTQISELRAKFGRSLHPASQQIDVLLGKIVEFRALSDPSTRSDRSTLQDAYLIDELNKIATAFNATTRLRDEEAKKAPNSEVANTLSAAVEYCTQSVKERLESLDKKDKLLTVYNDSKNQLKSYVPLSAGKIHSP